MNQDLKQFYGSEQFYKHGIIRSLIYTEGVKYLAETYSTYWFIDIVASYISEVFKENKKSGDTMQIVGITVNGDHTAHFYIKHDTYTREFIQQDLLYADLPMGTYEFYLNWNGNGYTLLLKSEN